MTRHDESLLWEYAARELEPEEARLVQHHLSECPDCQEKLSDVRTAQGALNAARSAPFRLSYNRVDAALSTVIDRKLQAQAMGRRWVIALSGGLVAVGLALVAVGLWPRLTAQVPAAVEAPAPVAVEIVPKAMPQVESAEALTRVGVSSELMRDGAGLESGDVLKTAAHGKATLKLPEGTRLAMKGDTLLSLNRVQRDQIALSLERGHIAVAASHARDRKGFVIHANGVMVTVVGTTFSVTSSRDSVEVAVADGRVSVETPEGLPQFVNAGQRVQFETRHWRSSRTALPSSEKKELGALTQTAAPVPVPAPVVAQVAVAPQAAVVPAAGGAAKGLSLDELIPLPVPEKKVEAAAIAAAPPAPPAPVPATVVEPPQVAAAPPAPTTAPAANAPAAAPPDMTGLEVPLLVSPVESVGRPPEQQEWAQMPPPSAPTQPAAPPVALAMAEPVKRKTPTYAPTFEPEKPAAKLSEALPTDQEGIFIERAGRALGNGTCERFLLGLEEVANDRRSLNAEKARLYRARCFDAMIKPKQAYQEYRRYLQQYPRGAYVDEARQVMGEGE